MRKTRNPPTQLRVLHSDVLTLENRLVAPQNAEHGVTPQTQQFHSYIDTYKTEMKYVYTKTCIQISTILFIVAKHEIQPNFLPTDEWINKTWSIHTMKHY